MKTKHYYIILTCFVLLSSFIALQPNEDIIEWKKDYKLTWDDFKGEPDLSKGNTIAMSAVSIKKYKFTFNKKIGISRVNALFNCKNSWSKTKKNEELLNHEQGHFDITEIYARKLRKKLNNKRFKRNTFSQEIDDIYNTVYKEAVEYQNLYDRETDHHKNREKQKEWDIKIAKELQELDKYSNPEITIKLK